MTKRKLNYRFHNPNPVEVTADYILKVMIEANTEKVGQVLQNHVREYANVKNHENEEEPFAQNMENVLGRSKNK